MRARALRKSHSASPSKQPGVEGSKSTRANDGGAGGTELGIGDAHDAEQRELLAKVAHELRTPLNAILGFTKLLHSGKAGPLSATQAEYLGDVLQSSNHLLKLLNDVLELARLELGGVPLELELVDPARLISDVCDTLGRLAIDKQQRIRIEPSAGLAQVESDPRLLKELVVELLSNAIRVSPEEGTIAIRIRGDGAGHFRIQVADSGPGIAPEALRRLFVPFGKPPGHTHAAESGLALALAKRLAEVLGGSLSAESAVGTGSVFSLRLPRRAASSPARSVRSERAGSS